MKIKIITNVDDFRNLESSWHRLLEISVDKNIFLSHSWLYTWWIAYKIEAELHIILVKANDEVIAIAPLMIMSDRRFGFLYRSLYFIGDGTFETDHMNFIIHRDYQKDALNFILQHLSNSNDWDIAHLNQLPENTLNKSDLLNWCNLNNYKYEIREVPCPICILPGSYEELSQNLKPRFRSKIRSTRKKINEVYQVEFGMYDDPEQFNDALEALYRIHESRWQAKGEQGVFKDQRRRNFYQHISSDFFKNGWLNFFYLKLDGNVVAQEYCFKYDNIVYLLQEGFDYSFADLNVGNALRSMIFEYLIEHNIKAYDFLAGLSRHKENWSNHINNDLQIKIIRPGFKCKIYYYIPLFSQHFKSIIKKILPSQLMLFFKKGN